ncbi:hypothetical protein [Rhizohabitans arisaemae]|uniref:hypothetical protein n=1 Tax=Rhizohabitans arisaemae TaxID=2720610 RepID=UPI0024B11F0F|nr:hypothetical protein [Rhizohabitans arisaemae]
MGKRSVALIAAVCGVVTLALNGPAVAAPTGDTIVTFTVSAGSLDVTVPASFGLGTAHPGNVLEGPMGPVTATDTRGGATSNWTASVYGTNFTAGALTVPVGSVAYWSGTASVALGGGTFTSGQATRDARVPLGLVGSPVTAYAHSGGSGGSTATWAPSLVLTIPLTAQVGTYSGTVTHSLS